ncbi:MAG TPA: helix-turn-helix transcriptional regulator [Candidatus Faecimonas gallistercoris]|nr:helix-turn-helix transcriptional regulator [Bacilli bacterium]HIR49369.1 helix-turn-helix transcriptional regulator [Candidatus Faecimonas gallistercoris]
MIYERMKDIRTYFGNTQKELAGILGVSRSTYAGWENGLDAIILPKLNDFCNYYGVSLDYICGLTNTKKYDVINDKIDKSVLGNNLKETRTKNKHTQEKVANIINVDQSNYSKCELGKMYIHTYALIEFAKHYKVSIDWLCGKTKDSEIK